MPTVNVTAKERFARERSVTVTRNGDAYTVADLPTDIPLIEIEIGTGYTQVQLPNGFAYDEGDTEILTLDQLDELDATLFDGGSPVLINNGLAEGAIQEEGTVRSISVAGADVDDSIAAPATNQYTASVTYMNGGTEDFDETNSADEGVTWASSDVAVATIDGDGLATGVAAGTTEISASFRGRTGSVTLTVT